MNTHRREIVDMLVETAAILVITTGLLYLAYKFGIYLATGGS